MARERHLNHAPIVEAIIDFQARLPAEFAPKEFLQLKRKLGKQYPTIEEGLLSSVKIKDGKPEIEPDEAKGIQGYKFTSKDGKEVAQFKVDGFTFSRLRPYTNWEKVLSEAKRLWEFYHSKASPLTVEKISVRYLNRLDIKFPLRDLEDYLTASPELPKTLPQTLNQFLINLIVQEKDLVADIIQTLIKSPKPKHIGIILGIAVHKEDPKGLSDENIWPVFDRMRKLKNKIFFELITEKTARLFE